MTTEAPAARRGRPRDPAADRAIMDAARDVVARRGFTGASMDEIARIAGVGKDTLYRRHRSKVQLVRAVLSDMADTYVPVPADEDPTFALFVFLQDVVRVNVHSDFGRIVAGVVGEATRNDDLAEAFTDFWAERRGIAAGLVSDIVGTAADEVEIARLLDHILGPVYYRLLLTRESVTDEYLWDLVSSLHDNENSNHPNLSQGESS